MPADDVPLPFVTNCDVGVVPDGGIVILLTFATSKERFESGALDTAAYAMDRDIAIRLAKTILKASGEGAPSPLKPRRH